MEASCSLSSLIQHRQEMQLRQPLEHRAWHAEEAISAQKRGYYVTRVQLGLTWVALHLAGEEGWGRGMLLKSRVLFPFFTGSCSEQKATSKILSIKLPGYSFKLHLNVNEDHYSTWELKSLLSLWLSLPLSVFPSRSLSSLPSLRWYLHVNDFCISAFLSPSLFFLPPIYMSVAFAAWWCCVAMKVICSVTVRQFYQLLLSSILVSEYWWQWNQGAVKTFCKLPC